ncbi:MAG: hypothetical protein AAGE59_25335 [Cyanobacteria bacterium P01_F01_bin.86]
MYVRPCRRKKDAELGQERQDDLTATFLDRNLAACEWDSVDG